MSIAYMAQTKRNITAEDLAAAQALSELWMEYKKKHPGVTETQVAEKLGIHQSMFNQLKNAKVTWSTDHVLMMASFFGVPHTRFRPIEHWAKSHMDEYLVNTGPGPAIRGQVPLISWVRAGDFCGVHDPLQPGDAEEWLSCPVAHGKSTYVLKVRGESMLNPHGRPSFNDGDLIFIDPDRQPEHGALVIVRLDDAAEATFKRLIIEGDKKYLKALNPAWPEPIIEVSQNSTICGVVIFKGERI